MVYIVKSITRRQKKYLICNEIDVRIVKIRKKEKVIKRRNESIVSNLFSLNLVY